MVRGGGRGRRGGRDRSSPPAGRGGRGRSGGDGGGRSSSPAGQGGRGRRGGDGGGRSSSPAGQGGRGRGGDGDFDGGDRSSSSAGRGGRGRGGDSDGGASSPSSVSQGGRRDHGHGREHHGDGGDRSSSSASQGGRGDKATESPKSSPTPNPPSILGDPPADNYAARLKAPREELAAHRFFEFLQQCKQGSSGDPVYVAEVKSMRAKESWKLCVQFNHLRAFDRHFSHYVCNNRDRIWGWLLSAVRKFLVAQCIDDDKMTTDTVSMIRSDILLNADLEFIDITISIESLLSFLNNNRDGLSEFLNIQFETAKAELLPTDLGSHIFRSCVEHLIENHILGYSWNGDYTIGDWDIINGREVVLMKRPGEFTLQHGAADLGKLDSELILRYLKIDKDGNRVVPLYFKELDDDLKVLSTTIKSKDLHWYREYIRSHPALVPPMARIHLIRGLFREVRTFNLAADPLFKKLLTVPDKSCYVDWRPLITSTKSKVLLDIYWHGIPEAETKTTPPKFDASLGSLLDFKRNSCEHIEENSRDKGGKQLMKKSIEAEVFASSKVLKFLPWLIRKLLKKCNMEGCFREIWQVYKSSGFNYELAIRKSRG